MKPRTVIVLLFLATFVLSQDRRDLAVAGPQPGGGTKVAAWTGDVRETLASKGTFIPSGAAELKLDLKSYRGTLTLVEILPSGSFVNQGDVVARLEPKGIDEKIRGDGMALKSAEMSMRHAEEKARMSAAKTAASLARSQRAADRAATKLRGFREHEKAHRKESERMMLQSRRHRLEDQFDELKQLEKMYTEDELVDATEEIVLKRSKRRYASSLASFELSERRRLYRKEFYEVWSEEDLETAARKDADSHKRALRSAEMSRESTEASLSKQRYSLEKQREKHSDLVRDREQFIVRAPTSGLLLHGSAKGPWVGLEKGATLRNRSVFATVANPKKLALKTSVAEAAILKIRSGVACEVIPAALPDKKLVGSLRVDYLPGATGSFGGEVTFSEIPIGLRPGMTGSVKVILKEARNVILVPKGAIIKKGDTTVVKCSKTTDGPFEERAVVTGISDGKNIAIRDGLAAGEYVIVQQASSPQPAAGGRRGKGGPRRGR